MMKAALYKLRFSSCNPNEPMNVKCYLLGSHSLHSNYKIECNGKRLCYSGRISGLRLPEALRCMGVMRHLDLP